MRKSESGHGVLIVIIVVIVIAILGLLGWLFWKNFINTSNTNTVSSFAECKAQQGSKILETFPEQCVTTSGLTFTNTVIPKADETVVKTYCAEHEKICFEYPGGWTVTKEDAPELEEGVKTDMLAVASPDRKLSLKLWTGVSGIGGTCGDDPGTATVLEPIPVASLSGYSDEYNVDEPYVLRSPLLKGDSYAAEIVVSTNKDTHVVGSVNACAVAFAHFFAGRNVVYSYGSAGAIMFGDTGNETSSPKYSTLAEAQAAFETDNYKQAASILASLHYQ